MWVRGIHRYAMKIKQLPTASLFYGIWIKQSGAMVFIFNLDKVLLKKLFPTTLSESVKLLIH